MNFIYFSLPYVAVPGTGVERYRLCSILKPLTSHNRAHTILILSLWGSTDSDSHIIQIFVIYFIVWNIYACIQCIFIIPTFQSPSNFSWRGVSPTYLPPNFISMISIIIIFNLLGSISAAPMHMAVSTFAVHKCHLRVCEIRTTPHNVNTIYSKVQLTTPVIQK